MVVPLVIIRPEPGCSASLATARAMPGTLAHGFPLFEVTPRSWEAVPPDAFDALLIGSPAVFRHGARAGRLAGCNGMQAVVLSTRESISTFC